MKLLCILPALCCSFNALALDSTPPTNADAELATTRQKVAEVLRVLGDRAGIPETPDKFQTVPKNARWLTAEEAQSAFAKANTKLEKIRWWKVGLDPTMLAHAMREPAAVIAGCVAAHRAGLDDAEHSLAIAKEAAEFLIWAQSEAGSGVFPFPSARGVKGSKAFTAADNYFAKAEREGRLGEVIHKGWAIDDAGNGGLQFDNAEAGIAMLELYEDTHEEKYLDSARKAADWAAARPIVENWNYNSFSVHLLAKIFAITHERKYLAAATRKALVGVIPGQLKDGPRVGRWLDAHNAKPEYHYIMMLSLAQLISVMPKDDLARPEVMCSLQLGLRARNQDFIGPGVPTKNKSMEALLLVKQVFITDANFLRDTLTGEALDALGKLVSGQYLRNRDPLGPREWGLFLEYVKLKRGMTASQ
jgi:hypothetical protein